ncbi:MAG: hypothetical protein U0T69_11175 [Chitinophagales bacterium]
MKQLHKYLLPVICALCIMSCSRKTPQVIYQEKIVTHTDTINVTTKETDTIPCADFNTSLITDQHDTVYVKVTDKQLSIKYLKKTDTVYKQTIIVQPAPLRVVNRTRIDNSVKIKAKQGSAIGDGNKITTKKELGWWWIFLAGLLSWFIIQNVGFRLLKTYFPFLRIFF